MIIGVVSDTHSYDVPTQVTEALSSTDLIVHAGDFCDMTDVEVFSALGEFKAVHGNMDSTQVRKVLPRKQIFTCEDVTVGVFHGEGARKNLMDVVRREFSGDDVDLVIYGHSHEAKSETVDGVLYFNPGSPNDMCADFCSYGMIEIKKNKIKTRIVKVA